MAKTDGFYVYGHFNKKGECKYIGKGSNNRAWNFSQRSKLWTSYFKDSRPEVKILGRCADETTSYGMEAYFVERYEKEGHRLLNITADGDRGKWRIKSDSSVASYVSEMRSGENHWTYGKERPQETRDKIKATKAANPQTPYWTGKKRDPETLEKIKKTRKENGKPGPWAGKTRGPFSEDHKRKISEGNKGKKLTEETKLKISQKAKGRIGNRNGAITSEETKLKMAEARKKAWESGKYQKKTKAVVCLTTGERFDSMSEAAENNKTRLDGISACCNGRLKTYKGQKWAFT